ncbi:hypothetical protein GQE99_12820 [Maritimibacter sp. DP07]|uniref:Uncharacterized protein n=1 Tax=Maritimibacter harenae TaxID=2606218 RepID=A0A845M2V2_9RHOB|nr:hypothetical protein [Maritimibacter harenae]MZR13896.1 hypothetical protein [Maritimibacter harenae]
MSIRRTWIIALALPLAILLVFLLWGWSRLLEAPLAWLGFYGSVALQYGAGIILMALRLRHAGRGVLIRNLGLLALAYAAMFLPLLFLSMALACTFLDVCI